MKSHFPSTMTSAIIMLRSSICYVTALPFGVSTQFCNAGSVLILLYLLIMTWVRLGHYIALRNNCFRYQLLVQVPLDNTFYNLLFSLGPTPACQPKKKQKQKENNPLHTTKHEHTKEKTSHLLGKSTMTTISIGKHHSARFLVVICTYLCLFVFCYNFCSDNMPNVSYYTYKFSTGSL